MFTRTQLARILCVGCFATLAATSAIAAPDDDGFVAAMQLYDENRHAAAYGRLSALADGGHAEAARVSLLMLRYGPRLYGSEWSASAGQIERWLELASVKQPHLIAEGGD